MLFFLRSVYLIYVLVLSSLARKISEFIRIITLSINFTASSFTLRLISLRLPSLWSSTLILFASTVLLSVLVSSFLVLLRQLLSLSVLPHLLSTMLLLVVILSLCNKVFYVSFAMLCSSLVPSSTSTSFIILVYLSICCCCCCCYCYYYSSSPSASLIVVYLFICECACTSAAITPAVMDLVFDSTLPEKALRIRRYIVRGWLVLWCLLWHVPVNWDNLSTTLHRLSLALSLVLLLALFTFTFTLSIVSPSRGFISLLSAFLLDASSCALIVRRRSSLYSAALRHTHGALRLNYWFY